MSNIKSLILGSAAVIAASAGAQAADLPVKAKAVQYVKICSLYGAGFYYIPGTDTCIKLGGYVQLDVNINGGNYNQPSWNSISGIDVGGRTGDLYSTRARNNFNIDTRTATEYGVVRTYMSTQFEFSTGTSFNASTGNAVVDYGFIQFAGFTFGKAVGSFQTPWGAYAANNNTSDLLGGYDNATGITQIAYTWQFGNGVSAQIGVEDNRTISRAPIWNSASGQNIAQQAQGIFTNSAGGNAAPDIAGNIRVSQSAFVFQVSGALHQNHATYYGATEPTGHPDDKWGGAASVGLMLTNLPTGPGDRLALDATWSKGYTSAVIGGVTGTQTGATKSFAHYNDGAARPTSYQTFAAVTPLDAVYAPGGQLELTTAWGFRGAFVHNWSPTWESSLFGSYTHVDFNSNASALICAAQLAGSAKGNGYTCNPDFNIWQIGTRTAWTPVRNLTFSAEVMYTVLDQSNTGSTQLAPSALPAPFTIPKPTADYDYKDQGIISGNLRVRRTW